MRSLYVSCYSFCILLSLVYCNLFILSSLLVRAASVVSHLEFYMHFFLGLFLWKFQTFLVVNFSKQSSSHKCKLLSFFSSHTPFSWNEIIVSILWSLHKGKANIRRPEIGACEVLVCWLCF